MRNHDGEIKALQPINVRQCQCMYNVNAGPRATTPQDGLRWTRVVRSAIIDVRSLLAGVHTPRTARTLKGGGMLLHLIDWPSARAGQNFINIEFNIFIPL